MSLYMQLPVDVLLPICGHLSDTDMNSVVAFALVCKEWEAVARTILHQSISFVVTSRVRLAYDVEECYSRLERTASFKYVRCLEIAGPGPYEVESHANHPTPGWRFVPGYDDSSEIPAEARSDGRHPFSLNLNHRIGKIRTWENVAESSWQSLASFIVQLPVLSDVVYNCASAVPSCVLAALRQQRCRLHVNTFRVPDLQRTLSAEFVQLITSPCLHSIRAAYLPKDPKLAAVPGTELYYDEEALMRIVAGISTNLKKMTILRKAGGTIPVGTQMPSWYGFKTAGTRLPALERGSLQELDLLYQNVINVEDIKAWSTHTDFRALVVLKIMAPMSAYALDFLARENLSSLKTLWFVVHKDNTTIGDTIQATNRLLLAIPRLSQLRLEQAIQTLSLAQIIIHHGSALRKLSLFSSKEHTTRHVAWSDYYLPTVEILNALRLYCPQLEYLAISIRRDKGSGAEIQAYRVLGSLPELRHLELALDSSDYSVLWSFESLHNENGRTTGYWPNPPNDLSFNNFDQQLYPETFINYGPQVLNGHVRDSFINCAIDECLARAIFDEILAGQQSSNAHLKSVQLRPVGGGEFTSYVAVPPSLSTVIDEISRSWMITYDCNNDGVDRIVVREVETHHSAQMRSGPWEHLGLEEPAMSVFQQVWPCSSKNWRQKWYSYPLDS